MPDEVEAPELIIESPRPRERMRLVHIPGDEPRSTSREALRMIGVESGVRMSRDRLAAALAEAEPAAALERATRLLGHRDRSRHEIATRLAADGYPLPVIEEVVERLAGWGYLDDRRFAESFVRTKSASSWGRLRISRGLGQAGVDDSITSSVLDTLVPEDAELERAMGLIRKSHLDEAGRRRELARLVRKGFTFETARAALAHVPEARETDPDR